MTYILKRPAWQLPESAATPESVYRDRRQFLKAMGLGGMMLAGTGVGFGALAQDAPPKSGSALALPDFVRNSDFADGGRPLSDESLVTSFNIWSAATDPHLP